MSKILLYTDVHWSTYSSIVRGRGNKFSLRLENLIKSVSWAESLADSESCDMIICLGDFFDKPELNSQELTALREVKWSKLPHYFIIGNHESDISTLEYSSTKALEKEGFNIISKPTVMDKLIFIPYITEDNREPLVNYLNGSKDSIILSHNDIKGIQYGAFESKAGFSIDEIENNCKLFLNGHLHNGEKFCKNGINLGNLTGQNFSEDAFRYSHGAFILDTEETSLDFFENPESFNFLKIDVLKEDDLCRVKFNLKQHPVITFRVSESLVDKFRDKCNDLMPDAIYKTIIVNDRPVEDNESIEICSDDYLKQFAEFILNQYGNTEVNKEELAEVCK